MVGDWPKIMKRQKARTPVWRGIFPAHFFGMWDKILGQRLRGLSGKRRRTSETFKIKTDRQDKVYFWQAAVSLRVQINHARDTPTWPADGAKRKTRQAPELRRLPDIRWCRKTRPGPFIEAVQS
jgi:hypothetical protein